jgi:hypothetical protein
VSRPDPVQRSGADRAVAPRRRDRPGNVAWRARVAWRRLPDGGDGEDLGLGASAAPVDGTAHRRGRHRSRAGRGARVPARRAEPSRDDHVAKPIVRIDLYRRLARTLTSPAADPKNGSLWCSTRFAAFREGATAPAPRREQNVQTVLLAPRRATRRRHRRRLLFLAAADFPDLDVGLADRAADGLLPLPGSSGARPRPPRAPRPGSGSGKAP